MNTFIKTIDFGEQIYIHLQSNDVLAIPYSYTLKIQKATVKELSNYYLIGDGIGIHFNEIDEDISLRGIIDYKFSHELNAS